MDLLDLNLVLFLLHKASYGGTKTGRNHSYHIITATITSIKQAVTESKL